MPYPEKLALQERSATQGTPQALKVLSKKSIESGASIWVEKPLNISEALDLFWIARLLRK